MNLDKNFIMVYNAIQKIVLLTQIKILQIRSKKLVRVRIRW